MLFSICYLIKWYFTPEKLIDYFSSQDYFILTGELFVHHIIPNLDLADLYKLTNVCKFYYNNNHVRTKIKTMRIENHLNSLKSRPEMLVPDNEVLLKYKNMLELLNPLLFTNQIKLDYNTIFFGPSNSNTYWLRIDIRTSLIIFGSYGNRYSKYDKLEVVPAKLIVALKESKTVNELVNGYADYYDIYCKKQWISDYNKNMLIYNGAFAYTEIIAGLIMMTIIDGIIK